MSSIASLYANQGERQDCYSCRRGGVAEVEVAGKQQKVECRNYTPYGLGIETRATAEETELMDKRLITVLPIGVDTAEFSNENQLQFDAQSEGGGGLSKYKCGADYQTPKVIKHKKLAFTSRLYVHSDICTRNFISSELQGWAFPNDQYSDGTMTPTMFTDNLIGAARSTISRAINQNDVIGVFGGSNIEANAYDGILAQAYWAYSKNAYFHSVVFEINEAELIDGSFLHAKYAGSAINIEYDSTQPTDADLERFATKEEVYERIVNWLNNEVLTEGGRKYVDATYYQNQIIVTSKWTADYINLQMTIDMEATIDWAGCAAQNGITVTVQQGYMPVDERPYLVKFRRYTEANILVDLPADIYAAKKDMDNKWLKRGQTWALYMDEYVWNKYKFASSIATQNDPQGSLEEMFGDNIYTLTALSNKGGTGLWFITAIEMEGMNENLRNIKHTTDTRRVTSPKTWVDMDCDTLKMKYDQLHGVFVFDFRLFASNLLCSPFVANLQEPMETTMQVLPCYNKAVRENFMFPQNRTDCNIRPCFRKTAEYRNGALYALPKPAPETGYNILVLEVGETLPAGALSVYQIEFKDCTTGIPLDQIGDAVYEYVVETSDGAQSVFSGKDLIITYVGNAAGTAFNITQTVTVGNCSATLDASTSYDSDYPFVTKGSCDSVNPEIVGRIELSAVYTITSDVFDTAITVTGAPDAEIDLSANPDPNDAAGAADIINAYFLANDISGSATGVGADLVVVSPSVVFVNIDPLDTAAAFDNEHRISMFDNTDYDDVDGLDSIEVFVYCQTQPAPVSPSFEALPSDEAINSCSAFAGWEVRVTLVTKAGCTFELTATVDSADMVDGIVSFEMVAV